MFTAASPTQILSLLLLLGFTASCQKQLRASAYVPAEAFANYASDTPELSEMKNFYARVFGKDEYTTDWATLDAYRNGSALPERKPYQDSWYPEVSGGTNVRDALTRYDRAFNGGQALAANWEASNHQHSEPAWFGHCNGSSVSTVRYQNPRRSVTRPSGCRSGSAGCIEFTPADIRALLAEINMNAIAKYISGERCELSREELDRRGRGSLTRMDACDDVNPGSFHVGLVNFLGRMKQPLIFDVNQDKAVWNYPIYSYSYSAFGPLLVNQALASLQESSSGTWTYNPAATSWYRVIMTVRYRSFESGFDAAGTFPDLASKTYEYVLELDSSNRIIGGEWIGNSRRDHPDFMWMPFEVVKPQNQASSGNFFVNPEEVNRLWAESVGLDPNNPFRDKPDNPYDVRFYPRNADLVWGQVPGYYRMILDGRQSGAIFRGKQAHLRVEAQEALAGSSVELLVNGAKVSSGTLRGGRVDLLFSPRTGINILSLRWISTRVAGTEVNWDFRVFAM